MYHIKSDKRARCSSDMICRAMLKTREEKPFYLRSPGRACQISWLKTESSFSTQSLTGMVR